MAKRPDTRQAYDAFSSRPRRGWQAESERSAGYALSVVSVIVGALTAILLMPEDVEPRAALQVPAISFVVALSVVPLVDIIRHPKNIFRAEYVVILGPAYWLLLDLVQARADQSGVDRQAVEGAFVAIALFVAGACVGCISQPWPLPRSVRTVAAAVLPIEFYYRIGMVAFVLAFCRYAIPARFDLGVIITALQGGRWDGPWQRGDLGGADAFLEHVGYFGYLLPPLIAIVQRRCGWLNHRTLLLVFGSIILSAFLIQSGGRRLIGFYVGSGLLVWFLENQRVRLSAIVVLLATFVGFVALSERMLSNRDGGLYGALTSSLSAQGEMSQESEVFIRVDDNFHRLAQMTSIFPSQVNYTTWHYVIWVAARPVPRLFWPGKPVNPGFDLPSFVGLTGVSLSSSVVGELFMAGGLVATTLGGWFYGRLSRALSELLERSRTPSGLIIYSIGVFALFIGLRSMIELVLTSYVILAWIILVRIHDSKHLRSWLPASRGSRGRVGVSTELPCRSRQTTQTRYPF